jgi:hypothetical protein
MRAIWTGAVSQTKPRFGNTARIETLNGDDVTSERL